jgi:hypothetical protein
MADRVLKLLKGVEQDPRRADPAAPRICASHGYSDRRVRRPRASVEPPRGKAACLAQPIRTSPDVTVLAFEQHLRESPGSL